MLRIRKSPRGPGAVPGLARSGLAHRQAAFAVELVAIEEPARLLRGQGHFLAVLGRAFLLAGLGPSGCSSSSSSSPAAPGGMSGAGMRPLSFFIASPSCCFLSHMPLAALLQFPQAVHELGDAAVQHLGVVPGVGVGAVQLQRALEIARGALPFGQGGAMHLQRALHRLGGGLQLLARAPAAHVGGDHLLHVVAGQRFLAPGGWRRRPAGSRLGRGQRLAWRPGPSSTPRRPVRTGRGRGCKARAAGGVAPGWRGRFPAKPPPRAACPR